MGLWESFVCKFKDHVWVKKGTKYVCDRCGKVK